MPSYRAIGRYWSKLDLPITSDQPIKSIFLKFVMLVVFGSSTITTELSELYTDIVLINLIFIMFEA